MALSIVYNAEAFAFLSNALGTSRPYPVSLQDALETMGRVGYRPNTSSLVQSDTTLQVCERLFLVGLLHEENFESLEVFGNILINRMFADRDVLNLINITNYVFKSLALTRVNWGDSLWTQAVVGINHRLHRAANDKIYAIRHDISEYRQLQPCLDAVVANVHIENASVVFLFVTSKYIENFELWMNASVNKISRPWRLIILTIGSEVFEEVARIVAEFNLKPVLLHLSPPQTLTVCGNGFDLNFLWFVKIYMANFLVSRNNETIYTDLDSYWLGDVVWMYNEVCRSESHLAFMPTYDMPAYGVACWGFVPCAGFFAVSRSPEAKEFMSSWLKFTEIMFDDQIGLFELCRDNQTQWMSIQGQFIQAASKIMLGAVTVKLGVLRRSIAIRSPARDVATAQRELAENPDCLVWHPRWVNGGDIHKIVLSPKLNTDYLARESLNNPDVNVHRLMISIKPYGDFGSQFLQYVAALSICQQLPHSQVHGFELADYDITTPAVVPMPACKIVTVTRRTDLSLSVLATELRSSNVHLVLDYHMRDSDLFWSAGFFINKFPLRHTDGPEFGDSYILIHVSMEEAQRDEQHRTPLVPVKFYRYVVELTKKSPVFLGGLPGSPYVKALRTEFPQSLFLPSEGQARDFDKIRKARHVVIAVTAFSWLAAWLSNARSIHLPIAGWINPAYRPDINLLPQADPRFQFYLFPLYFPLPEILALRQHHRMDGMWKLVSPNFITFIKNRVTVVDDEDGDVQVNDVWYFHEYIDAAMEVSQGFYKSAKHHFLDVGRRRGNLPEPTQTPGALPSGPLLSHGKRCTQSSLSAWSRGQTKEQDAEGAVDGDSTAEYAFHTEAEHNPWWQIDLGGSHQVSAIAIYNRRAYAAIEIRAVPLAIEYSTTGEDWVLAKVIEDAMLLSSALAPCIWTPDKPVIARFIKLTVRNKFTYLHLAQVEIYGVTGDE